MNIGVRWRLDTMGLYIAVTIATACVAVAEKFGGSLDGKVILANRFEIYAYDPGMRHRKLIIKSPYPVSLDIDAGKSYIYWSDLSTRQVLAYAPDTSKLMIICNRRDWMPSSIAVDSFNDNVYVVDTLSRTVHMFDINRQHHVVIIGRSVADIIKVEIDPYEGFLFILDKNEIFRTDLSGEFRVTVASKTQHMKLNADPFSEDRLMHATALGVMDICLDLVGKRIYYVDSQNRAIGSSGYNGDNRLMHFSESSERVNFEPHAALTFFEDTLFWLDSVYQKIITIAVPSNELGELLKKGSAIKAVGLKNRHYLPLQPNPCLQNNQRCQHMCIMSKGSKRFRCACDIGFYLAVDQMSCVPITERILFTAANFLRGLALNFNEITYPDAIDPSNFNVGIGVSVDYDARKNVIYYSSQAPKNQLHVINLATKNDVALVPDVLSNRVGKFIYDWVTGNIYYTTHYYTDFMTLSVMNVERPTFSRILIYNLTDPVVYMAIFPNRGYLYLGQTSSSGDFVARLGLEGSHYSLIAELEEPGSLGGLDIDYARERLYWAENKKVQGRWNYVQLYSANLDGLGVEKAVVSARLDYLKDMAVYGQHVYGIMASSDSIIRLNKLRPDIGFDRYDYGFIGGLSALKVSTIESQMIVQGNPCRPGHDCEKLCLTALNGVGGYCACPYGEKLDQNGFSCVDNSSEEPAFVACEDPQQRCPMATSKPVIHMYDLI